MPDLRLPQQLNAIGKAAVVEAVARGAGTVEAEHVLLAILAEPTSPVAGSLAIAGLDHASFARALDAERARSLGVVGIASLDSSVLTASPRTGTGTGTGAPAWGASVRDLLKSADKPAARDGRAGALELELTVGMLRAELGTLPRALALAGVDRTDLIQQLRG